MAITSDIISLLANQGNAQAAGALREGDIAAQEAARKQALWSTIIGTGVNVAMGLPGQIAQMRDQKALADERNAKVQAAQRAQALDDRANGILNTLMTPEGRVDRNKLRTAFAQGKIPVDIQSKYFDSIDKVDAANDKYESARTDAQADIANEILTGIDAGGDPDAMIALGLAHAKAKPGLMTSEEQQQIGQALTSTDDPKSVLKAIRGRSEKYKELQKPQFAPRESPGYVQGGEFHPLTVPANARPEAFQVAGPDGKPITIQGSFDPAKKQYYGPDGNPVTPLGPKPVEKNPPPLDEQLADTLKSGDTAGAQRIRDAIRMAAEARKDPAQAAMAAQMAGLNVQLASERLKQLRSVNAPVDAESVAYWTKQIQHDPTQWNMLASNKPLQNAVQAALPKSGTDLEKLTQQGRAMKETAREILPHIETIEKEAQALDAKGLMGPIRGRWRDLTAGKIGAGSLVGPSNAKDVGKFATDVGLLMTAVARAHGGARGGGSPAMLEHMKSIMDAHGKDLDVFLGNLSATKDWMRGYAAMGEKTTPESDSFKVGDFTVTVKK